MTKKQHDCRLAHGFTLVELLVVISIVTVLAAISLPTIKNTLREQRVSRAAGLIQQYIEEARSKAISTGHPVGVVLERTGSDNVVNRSQVTRMKICNSPPEYSGDLGVASGIIRGFSALQIGLSISATDAILLQAAFANKTGDLSHPSFVAPLNAIQTGDALLIGEERIPFTINSPIGTTSSSGSMIVDPADPARILVSASIVGNGVLPKFDLNQNIRYAIQRQPTPSYAAPLDIPDKTVIDLVYSGLGPFGTRFSPLTIDHEAEILKSTPLSGYSTTTSPAFDTTARSYEDVWIVFAPDGSVQQVFQTRRAGPTTNTLILDRYTPLFDIYLLVGRAGQVFPESPLVEDNSGIPNILDGQAIWISINRMSGNVSSSPIAVPDLTDSSITTATGLYEKVTAAVALARKFARNTGLSQ